MAGIGLFDSGVGGLTVARQLVKELPGVPLLYFADLRRQPYGPKPLDTIRGYALEITGFLEARGADLVLMACNTSTAAALAEARARHRIPVMGVIEPGSRHAARLTRNGRIGVIGTEGTTSARAYTRAITAVKPEAQVWEQPCPLYVSLVEKGEWDTPFTREVTREYLQPLVKAGVDTLVLGCTHYPPLEGVIREVMGDGVALVDPAEEAAREASRVLRVSSPQTLEAAASGAGRAEHLFFVNGDPERFRRVGELVFGGPLAKIVPVYMA